MFFIIPRRASKALLYMTNQQMNRCLKDLCEICDYKSMKPYIDITESAKNDAIKKMEEAFKKK